MYILYDNTGLSAALAVVMLVGLSPNAEIVSANTLESPLTSYLNLYFVVSRKCLLDGVSVGGNISSFTQHFGFNLFLNNFKTAV